MRWVEKKRRKKKKKVLNMLTRMSSRSLSLVSRYLLPSSYVVAVPQRLALFSLSASKAGAAPEKATAGQLAPFAPADWANHGVRLFDDDKAYEPPQFQRELRTDESREKRLARLNYASRKTGILENDLLLGTFVKKHLAALTSEQLDMYERLLWENDWDIYYWMTGLKKVPEVHQNSLMLMLQEHAKNTERKVLRQPDL